MGVAKIIIAQGASWLISASRIWGYHLEYFSPTACTIAWIA
jgi:hypothetical protein